MHTSTIFSTLVLATSALVSGQWNNITSKPFSLVLGSSNSTLNGAKLYACHAGAAIEGLCVGNKRTSGSSSKFNFNTSSSTNEEGFLAWYLIGGNFELSEPMELSYDPTSNIAVPLFNPSESGTYVGFDKKDKLYIKGYTDDSVVPLSHDGPKTYYRWYACTTIVGTYEYHALAWVLGNKEPQNPTCQYVTVTRAFFK